MRKKQIEMYKKMKEDDIPITRGDDDKPITPNYIYKWKKRMKPSLSTQPDFDLMEKRLEKKLEKGRIKPIYQMNRHYTPEQQLEEVHNKTDLGYEWMLAEHKLLKYLLSL